MHARLHGATAKQSGSGAGVDRFCPTQDPYGAVANEDLPRARCASVHAGGGSALTSSSDCYWDIMEHDAPESWPGSVPWTDAWGNVGTLPDSAGFGAHVDRTRVPPDALPDFWVTILKRYARLPSFTVGPRDTPGLARWLADHGYTHETREAVLILPRTEWDRTASGSPLDVVRRVEDVDALGQVIALDHLVFGDPLLDDEALRRELTRLGSRRRIYLVPGHDMALATGGFTAWSQWALLWGAETHPDHRRKGYYRAIVAARLLALSRLPGVRFAAVFANDETSAPILRRAGFVAIGHRDEWRPPLPPP